MDICHFKNAELEAKHHKYKGRVVLRGDVVKTILMGQVDGVPKAGAKQAAADSRGSRTCMCAITFSCGVAHAGKEG